MSAQTPDRQAEILAAVRRYKMAQLLLFYPALWGTLHLDDLDDMLAAQAASTFFDWCSRRAIEVLPQGLTVEDKRAANSAAIEGEGDRPCQH